MKNFDTLLAFGGSHTAGYMLLPVDLKSLFDGIISLDDIEDKSKSFAFPNLLSKKFNVECKNFSRTGSSDDRSLRLLPKALINNPNSFVLFAWSDVSRTEFFYPDVGKFPARDRCNYIQLGINWVENDSPVINLKKRMRQTHHPINDTYMKTIYRPTNSYNNYKLFNNMLFLDLLCKKYAVDYRHFFQVDCTVENLQFQGELWDQIDKTKILKLPGDSNQGFGSYTQFHTQNNSKIVEQGHYDQQAHIDFSNYIYEQIK